MNDSEFFLDSIQFDITPEHEDDEYFIDSISEDNEWRVNLRTNDTNVCFKIDTGAQGTVISSINKTLRN